MMSGDDPPYLTIGTDVSAKYKGAFCEAKIRKVVKTVKCKVNFKQGFGSYTIADDHIKGTIRVGAHVEGKHPDKNQYLEAIIGKIQDCSQYTVVFDDGDITTLRRTALCLKSGRHFAESETLDQLPLTNPEHFSNPVISGKRTGRRSRQQLDDSSDDDESIASSTGRSPTKIREKEDDVGKVVCVDLGDKKKSKDNWFPGLVVAPTAQDAVKIKVKEDYCVRSFKDGRYYTVPKKEATEFTKQQCSKLDNNNLKIAVEKALLFLDKDELPPHWDRDLLFGLDMSSEEERGDDSDTDSLDDEPREEKDFFVAQLYKFMDDRGTPINTGPTVAGKDLDLYRLFKVVHKMGGHNRVTNHNEWKIVYNKMGMQERNSGAGHGALHIRQAYKKYLSNFEDFYRKLGCTMVSHPRSSRKRNQSGRSLIRGPDRGPATPSPLAKPVSTRKGKDDSSSKYDSDSQDEATTRSKKERNDTPTRTQTETQKKGDPEDKKETRTVKEEKNTKKERKMTTRREDKDEPKVTKSEPTKKVVKKEVEEKGKKEEKMNTPKNVKKEDKTSTNKALIDKTANRSVQALNFKREGSTRREDKSQPEKRTAVTAAARKKEERAKKEEDDKAKKEDEKSKKEAKKEESKKATVAAKKEEKAPESKKEESPVDVKTVTTRKEAKNKEEEDKAAKKESEEKRCNIVTRKLFREDSRTSLKKEEIETPKRDTKKKNEDDETITRSKAKEVKKEDEKKKSKEPEKRVIKTRKEEANAKKPPPPDEMMKKRTRKKDDSRPEMECVLPAKVDVVVGDTLKVFYGPSAKDSSVTYNAKVVDVEMKDSGEEYFVHYQGWNTRYDEWIRRSRIAQNVSWTPTRAKRRSKGSIEGLQKTPPPPVLRRSRSSSVTSIDFNRQNESKEKKGSERSTTPQTGTRMRNRTYSPSTPRTRSKSPAITAERKSPVSRGRSPVTRSRSPVSRSRSPVARSRSPVTRSKSPSTRSKSPVTVRAKSPVARSKSPVARSKSPLSSRSKSPVTTRSKSPVPTKSPPATRISDGGQESCSDSDEDKLTIDEDPITEDIKTEGEPPVKPPVPRGRNIDLNQIRSEMKGLDIRSLIIPESPSGADNVLEQFEQQTKKMSSDLDDIYEFKEPEPLKLELPFKRDYDETGRRIMRKLPSESPQKKSEEKHVEVPIKNADISAVQKAPVVQDAITESPIKKTTETTSSASVKRMLVDTKRNSPMTILSQTAISGKRTSPITEVDAPVKVEPQSSPESTKALPVMELPLSKQAFSNFSKLEDRSKSKSEELFDKLCSFGSQSLKALNASTDKKESVPIVVPKVEKKEPKSITEPMEKFPKRPGSNTEIAEKSVNIKLDTGSSFTAVKKNEPDKKPTSNLFSKYGDSKFIPFSCRKQEVFPNLSMKALGATPKPEEKKPEKEMGYSITAVPIKAEIIPKEETPCPVVKKIDTFKKVEKTDSFKKIEKMEPFKKSEKTEPFKKMEKVDQFKKSEKIEPFKKTEKLEPFKKTDKLESSKKAEKLDPFKETERLDSFKKIEPFKPTTSHELEKKGPLPKNVARVEPKIEPHPTIKKEDDDDEEDLIGVAIQRVLDMKKAEGKMKEEEEHVSGESSKREMKRRRAKIVSRQCLSDEDTESDEDRHPRRKPQERMRRKRVLRGKTVDAPQPPLPVSSEETVRHAVSDSDDTSNGFTLKRRRISGKQFPDEELMCDEVLPHSPGAAPTSINVPSTSGDCKSASLIDNTPPTTPESSLSGDSPNSVADSTYPEDNKIEGVRGVRGSRKRNSPCEISGKRKRRSSGGSAKGRKRRPNTDDTDDTNDSCMSSYVQQLAQRNRTSKYNFYVELDPELDGTQRINVIQGKLAELRKTYMELKAEVASIDRRRKKQKKKEAGMLVSLHNQKL